MYHFLLFAYFWIYISINLLMLPGEREELLFKAFFFCCSDAKNILGLHEAVKGL